MRFTKSAYNRRIESHLPTFARFSLPSHDVTHVRLLTAHMNFIWCVTVTCSELRVKHVLSRPWCSIAAAIAARYSLTEVRLRPDRITSADDVHVSLRPLRLRPDDTCSGRDPASCSSNLAFVLRWVHGCPEIICTQQRCSHTRCAPPYQRKHWLDACMLT